MSDPLYREIAENLPAGAKASDFVTSLNITDCKPNPQTSELFE